MHVTFKCPKTVLSSKLEKKYVLVLRKKVAAYEVVCGRVRPGNMAPYILTHGRKIKSTCINHAELPFSLMKIV